MACFPLDLPQCDNSVSSHTRRNLPSVCWVRGKLHAVTPHQYFFSRKRPALHSVEIATSLKGIMTEIMTPLLFPELMPGLIAWTRDWYSAI